MKLRNKGIALSLALAFVGLHGLTAMAEQFILSEGTPIRLKLVDTVSSGKNKEGDTINFQVVEDVFAEDGETILIKAETAAWGLVTDAQKRGMIGAKGELGVSIDGSRAVDGKKVPLRANVSREGNSKLGASIALTFVLSPLFLLMKGKDAKLPAGTQISAYIDRDVKVNVTPAMLVQQQLDSPKKDAVQTTTAIIAPSTDVPEYLQKYVDVDQSAEALKALDQLKAQGLLTPEEYEAKKKALSAK